jgi:nucleoside-triphosphatase THEP1
VARWALIAGPKKSDKTDHALALFRALQGAGITVGGFIQDKRIDEEQRKNYDLVRLPSMQRVHLAREALNESPESDVTFCALRFDNDAFQLAREWIEADRHDAEVLFVGDISKVEVSGGGHSAALSTALATTGATLAVICVRADQLFYVVEKFGLEDDVVACLELPAHPDACQRFTRHVVDDALAHRPGPSGR